ncbi:MAG: bacteriohemerythrin [Polyangiaceae bacterium]
MPWHPSFATHLAELDAQHRYFIALIDQFERARRRDDEQLFVLLLDELQRYARYHFASEELLMSAYSYPSEEHRAEHRSLLARMDEMMGQESVNRAKLQLFLYKWLTNHIQLEDCALARHVIEVRRGIQMTEDE